MHTIHAALAASVTELKKNPSALIQNAEGAPVAILNNNSPAAYLVPASTYLAMIEALEDLELASLAQERINDRQASVRVKLDEL